MQNEKTMNYKLTIKVKQYASTAISGFAAISSICG